MASFDPFGLKEDSAPEAEEPRPGEPHSLKTTRIFLMTLLAASAALALVCAAGLVARVRFLARQPSAQARAPIPKGPKPAPAETPKEKPPEAPKAPAAPAPKTAPKTPAPAPVKETVKPSITKKVEFSHSDRAAKQVILLGPFLVRSKGRMPMIRFSDGEWRLTVTLIGGTTYQYRVETTDARGKRRITKKQSIYVSP